MMPVAEVPREDRPSSKRLVAAAASAPDADADDEPVPLSRPLIRAAAAAAAAKASEPGEPFGENLDGSLMQSLPLEVQEQLFGVLRAALEATLRPVREKHDQLEAKIQVLRSEQAMAQAAAEKAIAAAAAIQAQQAQAQAQVLTTKTQRMPSGASLSPMRGTAPSLSVDITPSEPRVASVPPMRAKQPSVIPTSYGYVLTPEGGSRRPPIETALENLGPIVVPDFGNNRRLAGRILVGLLVAGLLAAIVATILSYS
jgi:hypothetical protein